MYSIWFRRDDSSDYQQITCTALAIAQYEWDCLNSTDGIHLCTTRP